MRFLTFCKPLSPSHERTTAGNCTVWPYGCAVAGSAPSGHNRSMTSTEQANLAAVQRYLAAHANADVAALVDAFHPHATWTVAPAGVIKGHYRGRDQILGFFAHLAHETDGTFESRTGASAVCGNRVFVLNHHSAKRAGVAAQWDAVLVFTLVNERIEAVVHFVVDHLSLAQFWRYVPAS